MTFEFKKKGRNNLYKRIIMKNDTLTMGVMLQILGDKITILTKLLYKNLLGKLDKYILRIDRS